MDWLQIGGKKTCASFTYFAVLCNDTREVCCACKLLWTTHLDQGRALRVADEGLAKASWQHAKQLVQVILHNHLLRLQLLGLLLGLRACRHKRM